MLRNHYLQSHKSLFCIANFMPTEGFENCLDLRERFLPQGASNLHARIVSVRLRHVSEVCNPTRERDVRPDGLGAC